MNIAWIDVETGGVDPRTDNLLQVACLITDSELNILDETGYTTPIYYSDYEIVSMKNNVIDYVLNMHKQTGLWDALSEGKPLQQVDSELYSYLKEFIPTKGVAPLGGNSITLDRNFINAYLPRTGDHLSYRSVDVSSIAQLAHEWYNGLRYEKKYLHEAMADIRESIAELKFLRQTAFK